VAVLLPFILAGLWRDVMTSYALSVGTALVLLFALGVFLARVAHEQIVPAGIRMIVAGVVCVILSFFLAGGH
jgi:predicted membrane protein (TIGR00267 family)